MRRLLIALAVLFGLTGALAPPSAAQTAGPSGPVVNAYSDAANRIVCFDGQAPAILSCTDPDAAVYVSVSTRTYRDSSNQIIRVDGAARGYDKGYIGVGNVQVADVKLHDSTTNERASAPGPANSNGAASTALLQTPDLCVGSGTGSFYTTAVFSYRNQFRNEVYTFNIGSGNTLPAFKTGAC